MVTPTLNHTGMSQALRLEPLTPHIEMRQPPAVPHLDAESSARALLTDFTQSAAHTVSDSSLIAQALDIMKQGGVRLLFVLDREERFTGVITARDLIGGRRITLAMQHHQVMREDVTVRMVQTPRDELHALPLKQLERATIGALVNALRTFGDQHLLITEANEHGQQCLRGMVSASDVGRALNIDLQHPPEARSFASICKVILGHEL
ncbi:CBS domain-containing protein [Modicisalibacter muralis]|uniref:CBS domain-containing protein n=1 Tax=Modicisalibacter muralis TaxID=119000 RepID=A0A1G9FXP5_9GAMM|nr:CBS domain-containing protein [Halomonas muralis]SDK93139.1 CBS domain-containing protein [Halomonas muralis]